MMGTSGRSVWGTGIRGGEDRGVATKVKRVGIAPSRLQSSDSRASHDGWQLQQRGEQATTCGRKQRRNIRVGESARWTACLATADNQTKDIW
ncbi:hypothetical protein NL676_038605 [Syzygium grande]|nr:hypothetical protein NL676_038605 [Syzygium grande]